MFVFAITQGWGVVRISWFINIQDSAPRVIGRANTTVHGHRPRLRGCDTLPYDFTRFVTICDTKVSTKYTLI